MKKSVKFLTAVLLSVVTVMAFTACGSSAPASSAGSTASSGSLTAEEGVLHVATNAAFPPYEMTSDDGGFEGIDIDIAGAIAEKLGLELAVDDMDFTAVIASVTSGKSDIVMAGLTVTDERKENLDFTDTYAKAVQSIIVPEGSSIKSVDDLAKADMIGTQDGTTGYIYCSDTPENGGYGSDHVTGYTTGAAAIEALKGGKVDAVVIDNEPAKEFVEANPGLVLLDSEYAEEEYAIGVAKGNTKLYDAVNGALKELKEDGTIQSIIDKYIKAE